MNEEEMRTLQQKGKDVIVQKTSVTMSLTQMTKSLRAVLSGTGPSQAARAMTTMNKQSAEEYKKQNYNARQSLTGRPVSPHVTIYAFPAAALTSITNRVTGVTLSIGALGLGAVELVGGNGSALAMMETIGSSGLITASVAKLAVGFPCVYHFLGGCRHMMWDKMPETLTIQGAAQSSQILVGASLILTAGLVMV